LRIGSSISADVVEKDPIVAEEGVRNCCVRKLLRGTGRNSDGVSTPLETKEVEVF
jgi:hypothetical protein